MTPIPTQITFLHLSYDSALEADIRERAAWLEQFYSGILSCDVVIDRQQPGPDDERCLHVRVEVTLPGARPLVVSHELLLRNEIDSARKETDIERTRRESRNAVDQAFDVVRRRLEDFSRERHGTIELQDIPSYGVVREISQSDGCGVIQADALSVCFDRASVVDADFLELTVGTEVEFVQAGGKEGSQVRSVRPLHTPHYATS